MPTAQVRSQYPSLRLVRDDDPIEVLLDAVASWLRRTADCGEPHAYVELGDDEVRDGWPLTRRQVQRLAAILSADASECPTAALPGGHSRSAAHNRQVVEVTWRGGTQ